MAGVGRDLWGPSSPAPLPKQGHVKQVSQDLRQAGFEYLQRRRLHNPYGQPVPVLHHPESEVLPRLQMELLIFQFLPTVPCPVAGHHWTRCDSKEAVTGVPQVGPLKVRWEAAECWWHVWLTQLMSAEPHAKDASKVSGIKWLFLIFTLSFKRSYRCLWLTGFACVPLTRLERQATTALHAEGRIWMPLCRNMNRRDSTDSNICVHNASSKGDSCSGQGSQVCSDDKRKENSTQVSY